MSRVGVGIGGWARGEGDDGWVGDEREGASSDDDYLRTNIDSNNLRKWGGHNKTCLVYFLCKCTCACLNHNVQKWLHYGRSNSSFDRSSRPV